MAVGLIEGVSHVNWKKFWAIVAWWYLGCLPVFALTALFNWQGASIDFMASCLRARLKSLNRPTPSSKSIKDFLLFLSNLPQLAVMPAYLQCDVVNLAVHCTYLLTRTWPLLLLVPKQHTKHVQVFHMLISVASCTLFLGCFAIDMCFNSSSTAWTQCLAASILS